MKLKCLIVPVFALVATVACNKNQPSGVPDLPTASPAPTQAPVPAPTEPAPASAEVAAPIESAPPPLDDSIPPFDKTGFPDCDDYVEAYRQCLNTRLNGDERKTKARELKSSVRAIVGNIARGVEPSRVAKQCKKARGLAARKLADLGCPL